MAHMGLEEPHGGTGENASRLAPEKHGPPGLIITAAPQVDDYHRADSASESGRAG